MAVSMIMAGFSLIHKKVEDFGLIFLDLHFSRGNWAILMDMFFDSFTNTIKNFAIILTTSYKVAWSQSF